MGNVIYNELRMRGCSVDVGVIPITEKDWDGKVIRKQLEVDFVCNRRKFSDSYKQISVAYVDAAKNDLKNFREV